MVIVVDVIFVSAAPALLVVCADLLFIVLVTIFGEHTKIRQNNKHKHTLTQYLCALCTNTHSHKHLRKHIHSHKHLHYTQKNTFPQTLTLYANKYIPTNTFFIHKHIHSHKHLLYTETNTFTKAHTLYTNKYINTNTYFKH